MVSNWGMQKSLCVYCASSDRLEARYYEAATAVGTEIARRQWQLVYGGGKTGMMGAVARGVSLAGYIALGLAAYGLGREVGRDQSHTPRLPPAWCGLLAAAFVISAPLTRALAGRVYLETLGAALLVAGLWALVVAVRAGQTRAVTRVWEAVRRD